MDSIQKGIRVSLDSNSTSIDISKIQNKDFLNQNNIKPQKVQNNRVAKQNNPQFMQSYLKNKNNQLKSPLFNEGLYIDFEMPQMVRQNQKIPQYQFTVQYLEENEKNKKSNHKNKTGPFNDSENNSKSRLDRLKPQDQAKQKTYVKNNTMSHYIVKSTDHHIYYVGDLPTYHQEQCCCNLLYTDDCCLKWICDLFYQCFFLPFRLLGIILRSLFSICWKKQSESCFNCFTNCFYTPFQFCGDWANQCWFSWNKFCCSGLEFISKSVQPIYSNCCQIFFLQTGQFFKNCCSFPVYHGQCCCNYCFQCQGDCCQNCCTPQGFCEDVFNCLQNLSCKKINKDLCECICCCCVEIQQVKNGDGVVEIFKFCFCCICETIGEILKA